MMTVQNIKSKSKKNQGFNKNSGQAHLHYTVKMDDSCLFKPSSFVLHEGKHDQDISFLPPFKYHADAILGLSGLMLNSHWKTPLKQNPFDFQFCHEAWECLEPHHQVFSRTQERVRILHESLEKNSPVNKLALENFEKHLTEILDNSCAQDEIDLNSFQDLIDAIFHLETKMQKPLAFNYSLSFHKETMAKLHQLHAFLFHLRALVAVDYNSQISDATFEALKVDAISDYLHLPDYVTQDAIFYHQFKKIAEPYIGTTNPAVKDVIMPTLNGFKSLSHNAYCLIENLPKNFLSRMPYQKWNETLHLIQMDWALGTPAGLLFKIREELYGVLGGYEKLFWQDEQIHSFKPSHLEIQCVVTEQDLGKLAA
ncbi:MAG: hypothetical protein ACK5WZ_08300 [Pseudobdellovibrionaceae bacterium]